MKILMITQLFQPEPNHLKGLAFAREMARLGHSVEVLTGFPNYPGGRIYSGYRQKWRLRELLDNIPVVRVPLFADHSNSALRRFICYASLAITACVPGIFLITKPDVVHVYQGPATLSLPAMVMRLLFGIPYVLDIQDLWPESVLSSGMLRFRRLTALLHFWCDLTYRLAEKIVVLSPGYKQALIARGVSAGKVEVVYNWCDDSQRSTTEADSGEYDRFGLAGYFNVIYAGNFGRVQALDSVIQAAGLLQGSDPEIQFVFVGDGVEADRLKALVTAAGLRNVKFIPRQPAEKIGAILRQADALLIHLRDDPLCRIGIPQKTQAYLAAGRPIIMAVRGDAADLLRSANAGIICEQENAASIAAAVTKLAAMDPAERDTLAANGQSFYEAHLSFSVGSRQMESILSGAVNG